MNQCVIARIDADVAAIADNVARLDFRQADGISHTPLFRRCARQIDSKCRIHALDKSGAVGSVCQAVAAVYIRVSQKLSRVIDHRLTVGGSRLRTLPRTASGTASRAASGTASRAASGTASRTAARAGFLHLLFFCRFAGCFLFCCRTCRLRLSGFARFLRRTGCRLPFCFLSGKPRLFLRF